MKKRTVKGEEMLQSCEYMIEIKDLVKRYGANYALGGISFGVKKGEVVGFLGPNGAGKSTTMNILTGFLSNDGGEVRIGGFNILDDPDRAKALIGYLPEQPPLYPDMTVKEYLEFVYELKKCRLPMKAHLEEVCKVTKIYEVRDRLIANLSKGYKQRVGIAEAIVGDPKVIIFDEPTVGLDPKQIIEIRNLIRRLGRNHTVILSTHILSEVQAVCDRIIIIEAGKIIADRKTDDISSAVGFGKRYSVTVCGPSSEVLRTLRETGGVKSVQLSGKKDADGSVYEIECDGAIDIRKDIFRACAAADWPIIKLENVTVSLEDVFIRLTEHKDKSQI